MQSAHVVPAATRTPIGRFCPLRAPMHNLAPLSPQGPGIQSGASLPSRAGDAQTRGTPARPCPYIRPSARQAFQMPSSSTPVVTCVARSFTLSHALPIATLVPTAPNMLRSFSPSPKATASSGPSPKRASVASTRRPCHPRAGPRRRRGWSSASPRRRSSCRERRPPPPAQRRRRTGRRRVEGARDVIGLVHEVRLARHRLHPRGERVDKRALALEDEGIKDALLHLADDGAHIGLGDGAAAIGALRVIAELAV